MSAQVKKKVPDWLHNVLSTSRRADSAWVCFSQHTAGETTLSMDMAVPLATLVKEVAEVSASTDISTAIIIIQPLLVRTRLS